MSETLKEALSAVIDGEADEFELRRVLDEIAKDASLARSWERYHLIGSVLRGERVAGTASMRDRVWEQVSLEGAPEAAEPAPLPDPEKSEDRGGTSSARWIPAAVAATVAVAVVVGFLGVNEPGEPARPALAGSEAVIEAQQQAVNEAVVALNSEITPVDQTRTDAYIVRHLQQLGMNQAGIGFARMVAYERE